MFSMSTCGPCKQVKPILDELAAEYPDLAISYTVVDKDEGGMDLAGEWNVSSVPTLIFIANREEQARSVGVISKDTLENYVKGFVQRDVLQEPSGGSVEGSGPLLCGVSREENPES